jgi:hypothetical protein
MMTLKKYIKEMAAVAVSDLDTEFLAKAQTLTSFNLKGSDFTSLKYKKEIQHLFHMKYFPKFDMDGTIKGQPTVGKVNSVLKELKRIDSTAFGKLHKYDIKGVGPGEAMLFFILDDAHLGGGSSAGVDLVVDGKNYEIKAGNFTRDGYMVNYKLGATMDIKKIVSPALELKNMADPKGALGREKSGVNQKQMAAIKKIPKLAARWKKEVETPYIDAAHKYLSANPIIFMVNTSPKNLAGMCQAIKVPKKSDIGLDMVTQGIIKPKVKV